MRGLRQTGLDAAVREYASSGRPVLGVCLGMLVLFESSEEDTDPGMGLLPGVVRKLAVAPGVKVPHMGWNEVVWTLDHPIVRGIPSGTRFYFVHSFAPDVTAGVTAGVTEHGREFAAAVAHGSVFATQFHPERSGWNCVANTDPWATAAANSRPCSVTPAVTPAVTSGANECTK